MRKTLTKLALLFITTTIALSVTSVTAHAEDRAPAASSATAQFGTADGSVASLLAPPIGASTDGIPTLLGQIGFPIGAFTDGIPTLLGQIGFPIGAFTDGIRPLLGQIGFPIGA